MTGIGVNADSDSCDFELGDTTNFFGFGLTGGGGHFAVDGKCCIGITVTSTVF